MLIFIIILLLIIIFILCPAILGNLLAGVAIVIGNLAKGIIPLSICTIFYLLLFWFDKIAKKSKKLSDKTVRNIGIGKAVISFIVGMALAVIMNYAGLYFPSYVILFTSLIYPAVIYQKAAKLDGESRFMDIVWLVVIAFVALVFMYEFSFFSDLDLFGLHSGENFRIGDYLRDRELPSPITWLITIFGFPALTCYALWSCCKGDVENADGTRIKVPWFAIACSVLIGLVCGYALYEGYPYLMPYFRY